MDTLQYAKNITARQLVHYGWLPELARWLVEQVCEQHPNRPDAYHELVKLYCQEAPKAA